MDLPSAGQRIELCFQKWDGSALRRFSAAVLGADEHGLWVHTDASSVVTWPDGTTSRFPGYGLTLVPTGAEWWTVMWTADPGIERSRAVYGNISLPPALEDGRAKLVDLDLDVVRGAEGPLEIVDWDDFATNSAAMAYPEAVREGAVAAAERLRGALADDAEPFHSVVDSWFRRWRDAA